MSAPLLSIDDVSVRYKLPGGGSLTAVDQVSLEVSESSVVGLVGESGCGKSTLARAVCGLEATSRGAITFKGHQVRKLGMRRRSEELMRIQMVFQNPYASLNPRRTIGSQIADGLRANPQKTSWSVAGLLEEVELPSDVQQRFPHQFGIQQLVLYSGAERLRSIPPQASLRARLGSPAAA